MSRRGTILLAVGMVIVGLALGYVGGGMTAGFLTRRATVRAVGRFAAPGFYGTQRMIPYYGQPAMPHIMPYYGQPAMPHMMPFYGQRGGFGGVPFYAPGRGLGRTPSNAPSSGLRRTPPNAPDRGLGRTPPNAQRLPARRAAVANYANGARVTSVESNSPADKAGLKTGDVIISVAGTNVDARHLPASLLQSRKPGDKIDLGLTRGGQSMTISVTLGAAPQNSGTAYLGIRFGPAPGPQQQNPRFR